MPDPYGDMFRFPLGTRVRWAEHPSRCSTIYQRRWTEREILAPVVQYRFRSGPDAHGYGYEWVVETDLTTCEDE